MAGPALACIAWALLKNFFTALISVLQVQNSLDAPASSTSI
jgi:hypothetical protein